MKLVILKFSIVSIVASTFVWNLVSIAGSTLLGLEVAQAAEASGAGVDSETENDNPSARTISHVHHFQSATDGQAWVIVRTDGHVMAKPFAFDIRVACKKKFDSWRKVSSAEIVSACRLPANAVQFNSIKNELSVKFYDTDAQDFNRRSNINPDKVYPRCSHHLESKTFSVHELCEAIQRDS